MSYVENSERENLCAGLIRLSQFLMDNPDIALPSVDVNFWQHLVTNKTGPEGLAAMRALRRRLPCASWDTRFGFGDSDSVYWYGKIGALPITLNGERKEVCRRVVRKEKVEVEVPDPDLLALVPTVKREIEREVVEWVCGGEAKKEVTS